MNTKVWIFASPQPFSESQKLGIESLLATFIPQWKAHGNALQAGFEILENQFIKVWVDENLEKASGCSIDSLTHLIQQIEKEQDLSLLNRMLVYYNIDGKVFSLSRKAFLETLTTLPTHCIIYNTGVATEEEFQLNWKLPLGESWAAVLVSKVNNQT